MGACDISFELDNKATVKQIEAAFKRQAESDAEENGHASGYSGDFQTVDGIDFGHLGKVFASYNEAHEYCMNNAKKWDKVLAVYYYKGGLTKRTQAKIEKINVKYKALSAELQTLQSMPIDLTKAFKTCPDCKSRLATKYLKTHCKVCGVDLRPKRLLARIAKLEAKLETIKTEAKAIKNAELTKQATNAKAKDIGTLVAGWGAC